MPASKFSEKFREQVVLEVVEQSRTISEVARSYSLVAQTVGNWVNKWRRIHSGVGGEERTPTQLAEYKEAYSQTAWRPVKPLVRAHLRKAVNKAPGNSGLTV